MLSHKDIWRGIDRLAGSLGYSPSGLAKKAGLDSTSFNKSKRISPDGKPRWPSTESISKILAVTDSTMSDLIALIDEKPSDHVVIQMKDGGLVTGELLKQSAKNVIIEINGKKKTLPRADLEWIARKIWTK